MLKAVLSFILTAGLALAVYSCSSDDHSSVATDYDVNATGLPAVAVDFRTVVQDERIQNLEASIPPQCYTKTEGQHNPCYTCHQNYDRTAEDRLNQLDDGHLQGHYSFSDIGSSNHWTNLFVDRSAWLESVSDEQILDYINTDNYSDLAETLNGRNWEGFVPDLANYQKAAEAFDENGLALDGSHWVAFNYKPFLGTFWPTNGSTDDVLVRLPKAFRELNGHFNKNAYFINLTLLELAIKNIDSASIWPVDEALMGVDIDGNGVLGSASQVVRRSNYVGDAKDIPLTFQQFPQDAELMHSVRYVGVDVNDAITIPPRMKELRYMRKVSVMARYVMDSRYAKERKEKRLVEVPSYINRGADGLDNGLGWFVQGFIEDYDGNLRPQSFEETVFCMGCHKSIGTTIDSTFSFARKVTGADGWKYIDLHGMKDAPSMAEEGGEILNYLRRAGGGSEFRENTEMEEKWYSTQDAVDEEKVIAADVYTLLAPSRRRALDLNKAYSHIVRHQSFIHGRDATWQPVSNVNESVDETTPSLESEYRFQGWDIRLDWDKQ